MGKIFLNQISVCTVIGTLPHERVNPQRLTLDIEITVPMKNAALSDDLNDALDYSAVEKRSSKRWKNPLSNSLKR